MIPIEGFENYFITDDGRVFNSKGVEKVRQENIDGYWTVNLYKDGKYYHKRCGRLVGLHYLRDTYEEGLVINHKNLNVKDDRVENLEWVTVKENTLHSIENQPHIHRKKSEYSVDTIRAVCQRIQDGVRNVDIIKEFGITKGAIYKIRSGESWKWISDDYNLTPSRRGISEETAAWVCHRLNEGLSYKEILEMSNHKNLSIHILKKIKNRKSWVEVSERILKD